MGIGANIMEGLIREAQFRPFKGTAYTFGRPTMALSPDGANEMFSELGLEPVGGAARDDQVDTVTAYRDQLPFAPICDAEFFRMLGFAETKAVDVSDFEGAEIILDLNKEIPEHLAGTCDLLVDGSTLDNIFDPPLALRNAARMLKPDGRIVLSNQGNYSTHFTGIPYLIMTPIWFYDYFCINNFVDCQVYVAIWRPGAPVSTFILNHEHATRKWGLGFVKPVLSEFHMQICVYAERGEHSTWHKLPTQHVYRSEAEWEAYEAAVTSIIARDRKPHQRSKSSELIDEVPPGWWHVRPDWSIRNPETPQSERPAALEKLAEFRRKRFFSFGRRR